MKTNIKYLFYLSLFVVFISSCIEEPVPKPRGYFRIDLPNKEYRKIDKLPFPFTFDLPQYAHANLTRYYDGDSNFLDIDFEGFGSRIHMSYMNADTNLPKLLNDSRTLVFKHVEKAQDISEELIYHDEQNVFGTFYGIDGNAASGSQFYLTDSSRHFLRGALYFNVRPNFDSIAPVQAFIKKDILRIIESLEWKNE